MPRVGVKYEPPESPHKLFNDEVLSQILEDIKWGAYKGTAARAAGVKRSTWDDWLRWGALGHEPYAEFVDQIETAEAKGIVWHVRNLRRCASGENVMVLKDNEGNEVGVRTIGDWRPSTWYLSRKDPKHYSEKEVLRQAAEEALEKEEIEVPIPVLQQYLAKLGYELVKKKEQAGRASTKEKNNAEDKKATGRAKGSRTRK